MYVGGCQCGAIRYEITGAITDIVFCHCSQCRKAQGTAYATNGVVQEQDFKLSDPTGKLKGYAFSNVLTKFFCSECGSPIISRNSTRPGVVRIRVGTIETPIRERPRAHIFASSKAEWDEINDDLPQYDGYIPV